VLAARELLFVLVQIVVILGFICLLQEASGPHHMIMIYPLPQIVIAVALRESAQAARNWGNHLRRIVRVGVVLGTMTVIASELAVDARYLQTFKAWGGAGAWSDAIYDLGRYVDQHPDRTYLLMDWGFNNQLLLLCKPIKKEEAFAQLAVLQEEEKTARLQRYLSEDKPLLVFHTPAFETYPMHEWFTRVARQMNFRVNVVQTFYQRDGKPIYIIYEVGRLAAGSESPPAERVASGSPPEGGQTVAPGERSEPGDCTALHGALEGRENSLSPFQGSDPFFLWTPGSLRSPGANLSGPSGATDTSERHARTAEPFRPA